MMFIDSKHAVHSRLRFALAALCCAVFTVSLIVLARVALHDPLAPLRHVGLSALGVCLNFAVCLGAVAFLGFWRKQRGTLDGAADKGGA